MRLGQRGGQTGFVIELPLKWFNEDSLIKFVRRVRERWPEAEIERIEQRRAKQVIFIRIRAGYVKLIVYRDGRLYAYGVPEGVALAIKNIARRVLGLGEA